jgi:hypothetical protein
MRNGTEAMPGKTRSQFTIRAILVATACVAAFFGWARNHPTILTAAALLAAYFACAGLYVGALAVAGRIWDRIDPGQKS